MESITLAAAAEPFSLPFPTTTTTAMPLFANAVPRRFQLPLALLDALLPQPDTSKSEQPLTANTPQITYTTPSLDFPHFNALLDAAVASLEYDLQKYIDTHTPDWKRLKSDPEYVQEYEKEKNLYAVKRVRDVISLFNTLTYPPRVQPRAKERIAGTATTKQTNQQQHQQQQRHDHPDSTEIINNIYPGKVIVAITAQFESPSSSTDRTPPETPRAAKHSASHNSSRRTTNPSSPTHHQQHSPLHHNQRLKHPYHSLIASLNSPHPTFEITLSPAARAQYHFQRARIYAFLPWKDERVAEDLGRCCKLDPKRADAWNLMGEWYCRQGSSVSFYDDSEAAAADEDNKEVHDKLKSVGVELVSVKKDWWGLGRQCFERGLKVKRNRDGLLFSAQVLRAGPPNKGNIEESEKLCREALALDMKDGKSWFGLGCVYLKQFFGLTFDPKDLHKSLVAYNNAANDPNMQNDADLFGNRASVHQYTEYYQLALLDFDKCAKLDPLQSGVDSWPKMDHLKGLLGAVARFVRMCQKEVDSVNSGNKVTGGGKLKYAFPILFKKYAAMKDGVSGAEIEETIGFVKRDDVHKGKFLKVEIVKCLGDGLPRTFVAKDVKGVCMGVSVFNVTIPIQVGDELLVASPCVFRVKVDFEECKADYVNLRIDRPWMLSVNGKIVGKQSIALTEARFENL